MHSEAPAEIGIKEVSPKCGRPQCTHRYWGKDGTTPVRKVLLAPREKAPGTGTFGSSQNRESRVKLSPKVVTVSTHSSTKSPGSVLSLLGDQQPSALVLSSHW